VFYYVCIGAYIVYRIIIMSNFVLYVTGDVKQRY